MLRNSTHLPQIRISPSPRVAPLKFGTLAHIVMLTGFNDAVWRKGNSESEGSDITN